MHEDLSAIPCTRGVTRDGRRVRVYTLDAERSLTFTVAARTATLRAREFITGDYASEASATATGSVTLLFASFVGLARLVERWLRIAESWHGFARRRVGFMSASVFHAAPRRPWMDTGAAHLEGDEREVESSDAHAGPDGWRHIAELVRTDERRIGREVLPVGEVHEGPERVRVTMRRAAIVIVDGRRAIAMDAMEADAFRASVVAERLRRATRAASRG